MPALQVLIEPGRNRQDLVKHGPVLRSEAELWCHQVSDHPAVKRIASEGHTVCPQDIVGPLAALARCRAELDQREVTGATTEVRNHDELVVIELLLILIRRGYRLKHEFDVGKPGSFNSCLQALQGPRITSVI